MARDKIEGLDTGHGGSTGGSGKLFPDATLLTPDGTSVSLDSYRPRWDLVVLMLGAGAPEETATQLLNSLADARDEIERESGKVLVVTANDPRRSAGEWKWPFLLLVDTDATLHRHMGAVDRSGQPAVALFIMDRYREIFAALRPDRPDWPMSSRDVLRWLQFINIQCPECGAPE